MTDLYEVLEDASEAMDEMKPLFDAFYRVVETMETLNSTMKQQRSGMAREADVVLAAKEYMNAWATFKSLASQDDDGDALAAE